MLRFAYNTNGAANHRLDDALVLISEAGYDGVALTLDHHHLDPFAPDWEQAAQRLKQRLDALHLASVIETGARFLLDFRAKHEPTLVTASAAGRAQRVEFLKRAIDIGAILRSETVSFWAGTPKPGVARADATAWLHEGLAEVVQYAKHRGVTVSLEPEPGMLAETLDDYLEIAKRHPALTLALDLGHCLVTGEREPAAAVREFAGRIGTISIEDMRRGEHIHLPFGEGDMDTTAVLRALEATKFASLICVELSRESHRADTMISESLRYLRACHASLDAA